MVKKSHTGNSLSSVLYSAYELSHGSHRTIYTPASWFEDNHCKQAQNSWCQHHTVKSERKLCNALAKNSAMYSQCHGTFTVQSSVTTSFISDIPAKTRYVLYNIIKNIIKKNSRNPYLNQLLFIHAGISILREIPNLPPIRLKSRPLPQNLFQYNLFPPTTANISGAKKHINPTQAIGYLYCMRITNFHTAPTCNTFWNINSSFFWSLLYHLNLRNIWYLHCI